VLKSTYGGVTEKMEISASLAGLLGLASDNMIYVVIMFIIGLVFIVKGGDIFVIAATKGQNDMAIGNAVGSVTANVGLIMSISVL